MKEKRKKKKKRTCVTHMKVVSAGDRGEGVL